MQVIHDFNLYPLHVFRAVARSGRVSSAAQELYISQPAVSKHVRVVEARYGGPLFERTSKGMLLTPAGSAVLESINRIFAALEEVAVLADAARGEISGQIWLAASTTPGAYLLPGLLRRFQEVYPKAEPRIMLGDSTQVLDWLHQYRAPLGVLGDIRSTDHTNRWTRARIAADMLRLYCAPENPLSQVTRIERHHLHRQTLFIREQGSSTRTGAEALLSRLSGGFKSVAELASGEAIKEAVIGGMGVAVLSSWAVQREEKAGLLVPVPDFRIQQERPFYLVRLASRHLVGTSSIMWDYLKSVQGDAE